MKIQGLLKTLVLSTSVLLSSCKNRPLVECSEKMISPVLKTQIDSIAKESQKVLNDTAYKCFHKDTLFLTKSAKDKIAISKFVTRMNELAKQNVDSTVVDVITTKRPIWHSGFSCSYIVDFREHEHIIKAANYLNPKAVIKSDKLFTRDSASIYIPVEFYGIPNYGKVLDEKTIRKLDYLNNLPRLETKY